MQRLILLLLVTAASNSIASPQSALMEAVDKRLELMEAVAAYKWLNELAIEDLAREQIILARARETAINHGLRPEGLQRFFQQQMDAAKEIQQYWFVRFEAGTRAEAPADLATEVRPRLLQLGDEITRLLAQVDVDLDRTEFNELVVIEGLSDSTRAALYEAIRSIEPFPDRLTQILETGRLRVGSTGDYAPFSLLDDASGEWRGIDIDLAKDLAASLAVDLVIVRTSWPTLMQDLRQGLYDVGMSGISRNTERQRFAFFSSPYHRGGKTPIVRCADVERLNSLSKIDSTDVRIIVNPGGTNQRFVTNNIKKAQVTMHQDNRTIFDEIDRGNADVMITDAIEVTLKSNQYERLCPAMPEQTLTYLEKAYLMPPDIRLKEYVDTWLDLRQGDRSVGMIFRRHLTAD